MEQLCDNSASSVPGQSRDFSLCPHFQERVLNLPNLPFSLLLELQWLEHEAEHSPLPGAEVSLMILSVAQAVCCWVTAEWWLIVPWGTQEHGTSWMWSRNHTHLTTRPLLGQHVELYFHGVFRHQSEMFRVAAYHRMKRVLGICDPSGNGDMAAICFPNTVKVWRKVASSWPCAFVWRSHYASVKHIL